MNLKAQYIFCHPAVTLHRLSSREGPCRETQKPRVASDGMEFHGVGYELSLRFIICCRLQELESASG